MDDKILMEETMNDMKSRKGIGIIICISVIAVMTSVFMVTSCSKHNAKKEIKEPGTRLTEKDEKLMNKIAEPFVEAFETGEKNPKKAIKITLKALEQMQKYDGHTLECGKKFSKNSTFALMAYKNLIVYYDAVNNCSEVKGYYNKIIEMTHIRYMVFPVGLESIFDDETTIYFGDEKGYEKQRKEQTQLFRTGYEYTLKNCKVPE